MFFRKYIYLFCFLKINLNITISKKYFPEIFSGIYFYLKTNIFLLFPETFKYNSGNICICLYYTSFPEMFLQNTLQHDFKIDWAQTHINLVQIKGGAHLSAN